MLLLISPINHDEAVESIEGGADIVDVKNPKEGSLGANFPWVIKDIRELTPDDMLVSATLGDVPYKPGTVSLAAMGALVSGADIAMLDTAVKDGHTLFDYLDIDDCKKFTEEAHSYGLKVALAGSVKKDQLKPLYDIGCDVVGVRGAACVGGDRNTGHIDRTAVAELKELVKSFEN